MAFNKKTWINLPNTTTPINATGMNDLETRIKALDTSIIDMIGLATGTTKSIPNNLRINGADLNEIEGTGLFIAFGPCTNVPMYEGVVANHWYLIQIEYNNGYRFQMIQRLGGGGNDTFTRIKVAGTWQSWTSRNPDNYSTSEVKIGTWGGKPLYRKVYESTTYATAFNVPTENIERLVDIKGMIQRSDYVNVWQPIPSRLDNAGMSAQFGIVTLGNTTNINIVFGSAWESSFRRITLTLEYTKTTD